MVHQPRSIWSDRILPGVAVMLLGSMAMIAPLSAAETLPSSLKEVPADTAFYSAMLRNRQQIETTLKSKAWAELWAMTGIQLGWKQFSKEWEDGQLAAARQILEQKENQELVKFLIDAVSEEVFCVGGANWADFAELIAEINAAYQMAPFTAMLEGNILVGDDQQKAQIRAVLETLGNHDKLILVPDMVFGFQLSDAKRGEGQLDRLHKLLEQLGKQLPPEISQRIEKKKVGPSDFLTISLDGSLVPWDEIPWNEIEQKPGQFKKLINKLKETKILITLGIKGKYLLISVGNSMDLLGKLGGPGAKLESVEELKPLTKLNGKPFTSVSYVSKNLIARSANTETDQMNALIEMAKMGLPKAGLPEAQEKKIIKDLEQLGQETKRSQAKPGAMVACSFLSDRGEEGYTFDFSEHPHFDGSQPLTLLNHVGGAPLLAVVGRAKNDPKDYEGFIKFVKMAYGHLDAILLDKLEGEGKDLYQKITKAMLPLIGRLDEITSKMYLPSMVDGQSAFVIDAKWSSKQWSLFAPETSQPMPMIELGFVVGISDVPLFKKAMSEYRKVLNDLVATFRKVVPNGDGIPEFEIPEPNSAKRGSFTLYFYPIPVGLLDKRVQPTAGLSDKVGVLSFSENHSERLLTKTAPRFKGKPLSDPEKPLAGALICDFAALVDALTPWVELATQTAIEQQLGDDAPKKQVEDFKKQVRTVLAILKCYQGTTTAIYFEGKVLVTHSESVYRDLDK